MRELNSINEKTQAQIKLCEDHIIKKIKEKIKALQKQLPGSTSKFKDYNTRREIEKLKRSLL